MVSCSNPIIIQGGMGVAVSSWTLARAVSQTGQLGVVSGTALDLVLARRLQQGDLGGHMRRAMAQFPIPEMSERILDRYFVEGGKAEDQPFKAVPMPAVSPSQAHLELTVVSNFVEVYLAKEGHDGLVGVNLLEKIQLPTLPSLYGAMLAGVNYVLMGAGIPRLIPGSMDLLSENETAELVIPVQGADRDDRFVTTFDPVAFSGGSLPCPARPKFLAIVASTTLAIMLSRKANGRVDGFIIEAPTAGGHNAPPRGSIELNDRGEPIYGPRDFPDLATFRKMDVPFWLAGSFGDPDRLVEALAEGAAGIQVGTAFAYCDESGIPADVRRPVIEMSQRGQLDIFTDPVASPTGFPFKVVDVPGTMSSATEYKNRHRICDLGYLRHAYKKEDGKLGWRCPSEVVDDYLRKGGTTEETCGRKCVCNGLMATVDMAQVRKSGDVEKQLITSGDDVRHVARFLATTGADSFSARDVVSHLLSGIKDRTILHGAHQNVPSPTSATVTATLKTSGA